MLRFHEQIFQEIRQRQQLLDLVEPSPVMARALEQIEDFRRNREQARSLGFVLPEELQIPEVLQWMNQ